MPWLTKLPAEYLERGLKHAEGCLLFGIPLERLTHDELRAAFANEMRNMQSQIDEEHKSLMAWLHVKR